MPGSVPIREKSSVGDPFARLNFVLSCEQAICAGLEITGYNDPTAD